jgi:hypothetical protein
LAAIVQTLDPGLTDLKYKGLAPLAPPVNKLPTPAERLLFGSFDSP